MTEIKQENEKKYVKKCDQWQTYIWQLFEEHRNRHPVGESFAFHVPKTEIYPQGTVIATPDHRSTSEFAVKHWGGYEYILRFCPDKNNESLAEAEKE